MNYNKILSRILDKTVRSNPKGYHTNLRYHYKRIVKWIIKQTPNINPKSSIGERIYWIVNEYNDYPRCKECGVKLTKFRDYFNGYGMFCSLKCATGNKEVIECRLKTSIERYGKNNINNRNLAKNTMTERYGVQYYTQSEKFHEETLATLHRKYGDDVNNIMDVQDVVDKIARTKEQKYGDPYYTNIEKQKETVSNFSDEKKQKIKEKHIKYNQEHYGVDYYFQTDECKEKIKKTNMKNLGVEYPSQSPIVRQKSRCTSIKKYGVEYPVQSPEVRRKQHSKIFYNNMYFDSRWELAVYIYCSDFMIHCIYQPSISFQYDYLGKKHYYHPDFIINNKIYEVKGSHFISEDGTYKQPFGKSGEKDGLYEAKHQCMIKNGILVISGDEIKFYLDYVEKKYGKKWYLNYKQK